MVTGRLISLARHKQHIKNPEWLGEHTREFDQEFYVVVRWTNNQPIWTTSLLHIPIITVAVRNPLRPLDQ